MSLFTKQALQLAINATHTHTACHISLQRSSGTKALADTFIVLRVCLFVCLHMLINNANITFGHLMYRGWFKLETYLVKKANPHFIAIVMSGLFKAKVIKQTYKQKVLGQVLYVAAD